jgi:hypothetical protein
MDFLTSSLELELVTRTLFILELELRFSILTSHLFTRRGYTLKTITNNCMAERTFKYILMFQI